MNRNKTSLLVLILTICTIIFSSHTFAGRYDGVAKAFNKAARGIDTPPPNRLDIEYKPQGYDPPGLGGPSTKPAEYIPPSPPPPPITETFNKVR